MASNKGEGEVLGPVTRSRPRNRSTLSGEAIKGAAKEKEVGMVLHFLLMYVLLPDQHMYIFQ